MNAQNTFRSSINWMQLSIRLLMLGLLFPLLLFLSAGRLDWWQGWLYVVLAVSITVIGRLMVIYKFPDLLEERKSAMDKENAKSWDKMLVFLMAVVAPFTQLIVAGFDFRWHGSPDFPLWVELLGAVMVIIGYLFATWAMMTNQFFSSTVRIQTERGHHVIQTGPYSVVRHPGYSGSLIGTLGISLLLGSLWSFIPFIVMAVVVFVRAQKEDDTLQAELEGYREYTQKTRYRLIPGI